MTCPVVKKLRFLDHYDRVWLRASRHRIQKKNLQKKKDQEHKLCSKKERNCKEEKKVELNSHCMQSLLTNIVYF